MLYLVVFVTNASILIFEIAGARLLAPYLGTSVEVWAGTIAVILGGMAVGYWVAGIIADRFSSRRILSVLIFASSLAAFIAWGTRDLIPSLFAGSHALPLTFTAMLTATLLFMPTTILLAAVSPFVAKALITGLESSGRVVGRLNAIGTVGSIVGAILTSAVLIPFLGLDVILLGVAILLLALSVLLSMERIGAKLLLTAIIGIMVAGLMQIPVEKDMVVADVSTLYNRIWVTETTYAGQDLLTIRTDPFGIQCGIPLTADGVDDSDVVFPYLRGFELAARTLKPENEGAALFLGGCNYSYPRVFLDSRPEMAATVVEIDPGMTKVAEDYFGFVRSDYPSLSIEHLDARRFLAKDDGSYDIIFMDIFGSFSNLPHHLATDETFALLADRLTEDGVLLMNIISPYEGSSAAFGSSILKTARTAFPTVEFYMIGLTPGTRPQNLILIATKGTELPETFYDRGYPSIALKRLDSFVFPEGMVLTDEYAPVEYLTREVRNISF